MKICQIVKLLEDVIVDLEAAKICFDADEE